MFINLAPDRLKRGECKEEGTAVPADLDDALELDSDLRDSRCDNTLVIEKVSYGEKSNSRRVLLTMSRKAYSETVGYFSVATRPRG